MINFFTGKFVSLALAVRAVQYLHIYLWRPYWIQDGDVFYISYVSRSLILIINLLSKFRFTSSSGSRCEFISHISCAAILDSRWRHFQHLVFFSLPTLNDTLRCKIISFGLKRFGLCTLYNNMFCSHIGFKMATF